eukprot:11097766-Alexandrium_andersonii.AAC.1
MPPSIPVNPPGHILHPGLLAFGELGTHDEPPCRPEVGGGAAAPWLQGPCPDSYGPTAHPGGRG